MGRVTRAVRRRRRRLVAVLAGVAMASAAAGALAAEPEPAPPAAAPPPAPADWEPIPPLPTPPPPAAEPSEAAVDQPVAWRRSRAVGKPFGGRLLDGVQLPSAGRDFVTWDPIQRTVLNREWRRWGTDRVLRIILRVAREYRAAHPEAPRLLVGDLSRPRGGSFDRRFGGIGHASHQNGLDVDVYYPRLDRQEIRPRSPRQVDQRLAQDLVDRFVDSNAEYVFVGPSLDLRGPRKIVMKLVHHDDHLHFRLRR